jgi:2-methylisocitrate lyase-like PEP mutase family enzyme
MTGAEQKQLAELFRQRHRRKPVLLLPNVWDAMSARLFAAAGFEALATTSGGVAWALGYQDGEHTPWREVVEATRRIVRSAGVAVTADIEAGYGATAAEVAGHVAEIIAAGVVGINLEDGLHATPPMRSLDNAASRIAAARQAADRAGIPIVVNARCDLYFHGLGSDAERFAETVARCRAYVAAGADCVYPFGLRDPHIIAGLAAAVAVPVNITGRPGMPDAAALGELGVARGTVATAPALVAMSAIRTLAEGLRATGSFESLAAPLRHPDAQKLFASAAGG